MNHLRSICAFARSDFRADGPQIAGHPHDGVRHEMGNGGAAAKCSCRSPSELCGHSNTETTRVGLLQSLCPVPPHSPSTLGRRRDVDVSRETQTSLSARAGDVLPGTTYRLHREHVAHSWFILGYLVPSTDHYSLDNPIYLGPTPPPHPRFVSRETCRSRIRPRTPAVKARPQSGHVPRPAGAEGLHTLRGLDLPRRRCTGPGPQAPTVGPSVSRETPWARTPGRRTHVCAACTDFCRWPYSLMNSVTSRATIP